jgi:uncharacterized protein (DUF2062 family)
MKTGLKINLKNILKKRSYKDILESVIKVEKDPKKIARSISLGTFFGFLIPMGLQTLVTLPLSVVFKCNIVISSSATLVTNPITVVPIYTSAIFLGEFVTGISVKWTYVEKFLNDPSSDALIHIGSEILFVLLIGLFIMGGFFAFLFYIVAYNAVRMLPDDIPNPGE